MPRYILLLLQTVSASLRRQTGAARARQGTTRCRLQPMLGRPKQNYITRRPTSTNHTAVGRGNANVDFVYPAYTSRH